MQRFLVYASPRGYLTIRQPGQPAPTGWQMILKVNRALTDTRKDYAYRWLIRTYGL